jgi:hypothetical protein
MKGKQTVVASNKQNIGLRMKGKQTNYEPNTSWFVSGITNRFLNFVFVF